MSSGKLLSGVFLAGAYLGALAILFRWFASSTRSHVLPLAPSIPMQVARSVCRWRLGFRSAAIAGLAAGLLMGEAMALVYVAASFVPGVHCAGGWPPMAACTLDVASAASARGAALVVLSCAIAGLAAVNRARNKSPYQPFIVLLFSIIAFGAAIDLSLEIDGPARPQLCFRLIGALQWTAAAGFVLGALILPMDSLTACIRSVLAHMGAALVRVLGALSMLTVWPYLPPASAVAMLVLLLVPGVATALTGAVALSLVEESD